LLNKVEKIERNNGLDIIRWFLASYVIIFHFWSWTREDNFWNEYAFSTFLQYGYLSVDAFFVISGYAIATSIGRKSPISFTSSRLKRLAPTFIFVSFLETLLAVSLFLMNHWGGSALDIATSSVRNLLPISGEDNQLRNFVAWSLGIEIQFYVLSLVALIVFNRLKNDFDRNLYFARILLGILYLLGLSNFANIQSLPIVLFLPYFLFGTYISVLNRNKKSVSKLKIFDFLALLPILINSIVVRTTNGDPEYSKLTALLILILMLFLVIFGSRIQINSLLNFGVLLGTSSYALYLVGGFFGVTLFMNIKDIFGLPKAAFFSYLICALISLIFQKYFEKRLRESIF
jgi:peptidoglycan/LPS O-acetylase OafA/YrhL